MLSRRLLRIKIIKALYAHFKSESDSLNASEKNLFMSIDKTYELYHHLMWLPVEVARYAEQRIEVGRNKKLPTADELNPNTRFIDNPLIAQLRNCDALTDFLESKSLGWVNHPELIKKLYSQLVESDFYKAYMTATSVTYKDHKAVVEQFFSQIVCESEELESALEEQSIYWSDDIDFAVIMILRTLADMRASTKQVELLPEYKNDEDRIYACSLFAHAAVHFKEYSDYIGKYTSNWEVERIAFMDTAIMVAAVSELVTEPSIPVKVTLDEFIEISKYYSTPGSSTFINGVLDKVAEALRSENRIQKSGRGLLDK